MDDDDARVLGNGSNSQSTRHSRGESGPSAKINSNTVLQLKRPSWQIYLLDPSISLPLSRGPPSCSDRDENRSIDSHTLVQDCSPFFLPGPNDNAS